MRTQTIAFLLLGSLISTAVLAQTTPPPQGTRNPPAAMGTEGAEVTNPAPAKDTSATTAGNDSTKTTKTTKTTKAAKKHMHARKTQPIGSTPNQQR